jgi:hypothetical protein
MEKTALEKQTVIYLVHPRTMKIVEYMTDLRLRASRRHGGQGGFFKFLVTAGAPRRGRRYSSYQKERGVTIHASYLNTTSFIGNAHNKF